MAGTLTAPNFQPSIPAFILLALLSFPSSILSIGVNYGTLADNLPPPSQVASFLKSKTYIDRVKIFDYKPDIHRSFAGSGISLFITAPNGDIPSLSRLPGACAWVAANISPFYPATNISLIAIGNDIMASGDQNLIAHLVPAMRYLSAARFPQIRISAPLPRNSPRVAAPFIRPLPSGIQPRHFCSCVNREVAGVREQVVRGEGSRARHVCRAEGASGPSDSDLDGISPDFSQRGRRKGAQIEIFIWENIFKY
ncbi:Glucan endo-1,3-beta-glucosidase [Platanthera guangdongensis]|uniref:Glucan endo-1,3-beta-glucosidase n=1 Tax=Platanthera guangdongensis TaxID=2320717 RepID=A0ABR2MM24_9ASPA